MEEEKKQVEEQKDKWNYEPYEQKLTRTNNDPLNQNETTATIKDVIEQIIKYDNNKRERKIHAWYDTTIRTDGEEATHKVKYASKDNIIQGSIQPQQGEKIYAISTTFTFDSAKKEDKEEYLGIVNILNDWINKNDTVYNNN